MQNNTKRFATGFIFWLIGFMFLKYILQFIPGLGVDYLRETFSLSAEQIGFLAGSYFYAYLLLQIPAGIILDRFKVSKVAFFAITLCFISVVLFGFKTNFTHMVISRILMGTGIAFATVSYMRAASLYFSVETFSRLSGFFGAACMGGAGLTILVLGRFFEAYGWNNLLILTACFSVLLILFGFYFIHKENNYYKTHELLVDKSSFSPINLIKNIWQIIKNKHNVFLVLYNGLSFAPIAVFGGLWGKSYFTHTFHTSTDQASTIVSCLFYSYAFGALTLFNLMRNLKQQKMLMVIGIAISLILFFYLTQILPHTAGFNMLLILICLIGFFASGFMGSYSIANALNPATHIATAIAIINMGDPIFGGLAEPLMGHIIDTHNGDYQASMYVLIAYWVGAIIFGSMISLKHSQRQ